MMRSKSILVLVIALAFPVAAAAGPGTGADKTEKTTKQQPKQRLSDAELDTLQHHHDVNLMEIEMGKLAQQRGGPEVKKFAAQLVKAHQAADKQAIQLAKARGVTLSQGATPMTEVEKAQHEEQMATMRRLQALEGSNFDREFLRVMLDRHAAELGYMSVAIAEATDPKLTAHLKKVRPTIEKHANQARELLAKIEGNESGEMATPDERAPDETRAGDSKSHDSRTPPAKPTPKADETAPSRPTPYNPSR